MEKRRWIITLIALALCMFFTFSTAEEALEENAPVRFATAEYTIRKGERQRLQIQAEKEFRKKGQTTEWASSNEDVVTVEQNGTIKGIGAGEAIIRYTVTTADGNAATAECRVTVISMVTGLQQEEKTIRIIPGEAKDLQVTVLPEDASNSVLEWTSQDEEIAKADGSGRVWAIQNGKTRITAKTTDGSNKFVSWDISVPSVYTEREEYTVSTPGSFEIPVFFENDDFDAAYAIESTADKIEYEYTIAGDKAVFNVKPTAAGEATLKITNRKNNADFAEIAIHISNEALTNPERLRITNLEILDGARVLAYKFEMVNRSSEEIGEIGFLVDYRDQFGDTHYLISNSDGTIQNHQYTTMINILPGKDGIVYGQNDLFRANDLIKEVRVAICYYRYLTGEKVYVPDSQLYWYSTKTGEMELPEVKEIYAQPDEDTTDKSMRITLGATTCNLYKYVVKTFCRSKRPGVFLAVLDPNGNAARWGLQTGDVIYGADNLLWENDPFVLNRALCNIYDGKTVTLQVVRNGEEIEVTAAKNMEEAQMLPPVEE